MREGDLRWLAWIATVLPWAALVMIAAFAADPGTDTDTAFYRLGRLLGAGLVTLLPALLLRWLYTKASGGRVWSPWVFAIAALPALIAAGGVDRSSDPGLEAEAPLPEVNRASLIGDPPRGYRYTEATAAERRRWRRRLASPQMEGLLVREITSPLGAAGTVVVVSSTAGFSAEDVRDGMEDGTGRRVTSTTPGGEEILSVAIPAGGHQMVRVDRRAMAMVLVKPGFPAWRLARAILVD